VAGPDPFGLPAAMTAWPFLRLVLVWSMIALLPGCSTDPTQGAGVLSEENPGLGRHTRPLGLQQTAWGTRAVVYGLRAARMMAPRYPDALKRRGVGGEVILEVLVDERGVPQDVAVVQSSGHPEMDQAAALAIMAWQFHPWIENGQPTAIVTRQPIVFRIG
jgi:TonB family protein